jgi:hypothetical protein
MMTVIRDSDKSLPKLAPEKVVNPDANPSLFPTPMDSSLLVTPIIYDKEAPPQCKVRKVI